MSLDTLIATLNEYETAASEQGRHAARGFPSAHRVHEYELKMNNARVNLIADAQAAQSELADLRAKLATAEGVIEEANKMLTAARDANRDLTEKLATARNKTISLWYSIGDNQPLRSEGEDGEFVELWMDGGKLIMEDEREFRLEFPIGNTIALCRTGSDNAATGVIALVDRLLDEARDQGQRTVVWPETYSRRWFMRRLREELGIVGAAT